MDCIIVLLCYCLPCQGDGWTALHFAAKHGNVEIVKTLLKGGAEIRTKEEVILVHPVYPCA